MPSLENLENFKLRFEEIGNEKQINLDEGIEKDEYTTPENEPEPLPPPAPKRRTGR